MDNLAKIVADVEIAKLSNQRVLAVFLDITSAYDNVLRRILVEALRKENCPGRITRYINNWMRDKRTKFIISQTEHQERLVNKGLPQGGVISPTLYALYTRRITERISGQVRVLQYADDIAVYSPGDNTEDLTGRLEEAIEQIRVNLSQLGLDVEPRKTQIIDFGNVSKRGNKDKKNKIRIDNQEVESQEEAKFLGIVLDRELKFDKQIEHVQNRAGKALNIISYLNRVRVPSWGLEQKSAMYIYKSYMRAIIDYGLAIYYPRDWKLRDKLEKLQNKGVRKSMGYRNSILINVMLAEAGVPKLEDRASFLARSHWTKIVHNNEKEMLNVMNRWTILECRYRFTRPSGRINVMLESWRDIRKYKDEMDTSGKIGIYNNNYWILTKKLDIEIEIGRERKEKVIKDEELLRKFQVKYDLEDNYAITYTNGSVMENRKSVGIGIAMEDSDIGYKLSVNSKCSIFTAEALAIEKAIGYAQENGTNTDVLILTDSMSVCKALENNSINADQNIYVYKIEKELRSIRGGRECLMVNS